MDQFGDILLAAREELGMTQDEVAKATRLERKTYSTYELGKREPKFEVLKRLTKVLNLGDKLYHFFTEQNVPRGLSNLAAREPGPESSLEDLVKAQREFFLAAKRIDERIDLLISSKKDNAAGESLENPGNKDSLSKKDKPDRD